MATPDVTICIPAWQAEPFIDRTLRCARDQTYPNIRILVSVDQSDDGTAEICHEHVADDARLELVVHDQRLGWADNANSLLDRVETDLFFLYFHDDVIEPTYVERLRTALLDRPDALSAHCDLQHFGDDDAVLPGHAYEGPPARRMLDWLVGPVKGTTLRSLTHRRALTAGLRFPQAGGDGFWRAWPFHLVLAGLGPAVHVPEVLYRRWQRPGSLTRTWQPTELDFLVTGLADSAAVCHEFVDRLGLAADDVQVVGYAIYLVWMANLRSREAGLSEQVQPVPATEVSPRFAAFAAGERPPALDALDDDVRGWIDAHAHRLRLLEQDAR